MPEHQFQLIAAVVTGIISVGVMWKVVDMLNKRINSKIGRSEFEEHCKRIDGLIESIEERSREQKATSQRQEEKLGELLLSSERMNGLMTRVAEAVDLKVRRS